MSNTKRIYLFEPYGNIEEDCGFGINTDKLWSERDASHKRYQGMIKVYDDSENIFYVYEEDISEASDIIGEMF